MRTTYVCVRLLLFIIIRYFVELRARPCGCMLSHFCGQRDSAEPLRTPRTFRLVNSRFVHRIPNTMSLPMRDDSHKDRAWFFENSGTMNTSFLITRTKFVITNMFNYFIGIRGIGYRCAPHHLDTTNTKFHGNIISTVESSNWIHQISPNCSPTHVPKSI